MRQISEAEYERILDRRVQRELRKSPAYLNAADADAQADAEEAVNARVVAEMDLEYEVEN